MSHSTEPNDLIAKKDKPKIVQFQIVEVVGTYYIFKLLSDGRLIMSEYTIG